MKYTRMLLLAMVAGSVAQAGALSPPINEPRDAPNCERTAALAYCRYAGPDPQIVLMTGLGNAMQSWQPSLLEALSRFAGVIVYDRRGHGASAPLPQEPVTAQAAAADLNALLESLAIRQPVVLVGHSLGGLYAQFFARNYPRKVAAVVLLDAASPFEPIADPRFHTRAKLAAGSTDDWENRGLDASVLATRESPAFPRVPLIVLSATDHQSPANFEEEWQRIQRRTADQSQLGRLVVAQGSGHDIQNDRAPLVIDQIRQLVVELRKHAEPHAAKSLEVTERTR